ncbi:MAG: DUF4138 domain-containing protein [Cyclobacteriaceae bacterium]
MKALYRASLLLLSAALSFNCFAQADSTIVQNDPIVEEPLTPDKVDTIWVFRERTTLLIFNTPVSTMDIGTRDYGGQIDGTTVLLKPINKTEPAPTSIYIRHGEGFYSGTIAFKPVLDPKLWMLDFSKAKKQEELINASRAITPESETIANQTLSRRLGYIEAAKDRYKQLADVFDKIVFAVAEIMYDEDTYYLKILVSNRSDRPYEIDFMDFAFVAPGGKGKNDVITPGKIKTDNLINKIGEKELKYLCYAIGRHDLPSDGRLEISLRERNGSRRLDLVVGYKDLEEAKSF